MFKLACKLNILRGNGIVFRSLSSKSKQNVYNQSNSLIGAKALLAVTAAVATFATSQALCDAGDFKMPHRLLGNTGLQVSVLSYGFWATFGVKSDLKDTDGIETAKECLRTARDHGVNFFDNAEVYGQPFGEAERILGAALQELIKEDPLKWRRSDLIITTKLFWGGSGVNERGLSKKHIDEGIDASLARLQLPYVDLLFCHRPDPFTPTETVVRAMSDVVRSGKV